MTAPSVQYVWLPWSRPPTSLNDRQHHHVKAKATAQALEDAAWAVRAAKPHPVERACLVLNFRTDSNRRRDADNLAPVLKVTQDALVQAGILPDDGFQHVPFSGQHIWPPEPGKPAAMWIEIHEVPSGDVATMNLEMTRRAFAE